MNTETYSIKELETLSGVKAPTIRVWEKRFKLLSPRRTLTNIRVYDQENLRRLLQITYLMSDGFKISQLAKFSGESLDNECKTAMIKSYNSNTIVMDFILKIIEKDTDGFEKMYNYYLDKCLHEEFIIEILEPLLEKLQKLWLTRSVEPFYEKYILNRIVVKTLIAAEHERKPGRPVKEILIFHSDKNIFPVKLGLVYFLAAVKNYKIHYFFNQISLQTLREMKGNLMPDIVYTEFNESISDAKLTEFLITMEDSFPYAKNIVSGSVMSVFWKKIPNNVYYIHSLDVLNKSLQ